MYLVFPSTYTYRQDSQKADLVISTFTLSELPSDVIRKVALNTLWKSTNDVLVLIDRDNFLGFDVIQKSRTFILQNAKEGDEDAHVVAPVRVALLRNYCQ